MKPALAHRHETLSIASGAIAAVSTLALCTYDVAGDDTAVGAGGAALARSLVFSFGLAAWTVPIGLTWATISAFRLRRAGPLLSHFSTSCIIVLQACALLHLSWPTTVFGGHFAGGALGDVVGETFRSMLGVAGTYVVSVAGLLVLAVGRSELATPARWLASVATKCLPAVRNPAKRVTLHGVPVPSRAQRPRSLAGAVDVATTIYAGERPRPELAADATNTSSAPVDTSAAIEVLDAAALAERSASEVQANDIAEPADGSRHRQDAESTNSTSPSAFVRPGTLAAAPSAPDPFPLPSTSLLANPPNTTIEVSEQARRAHAELLERTLAEYDVRGRVSDIYTGPVITMFEFEPQGGTKISKIVGLAEELALALAAQRVRVVAPIPGKARVGFELPNPRRQIVYLRELLEDERWKGFQAALPLAIGRDIVGQPFYGDLSEMPHLLVAGATGSGKSVGLNVMLISLLMKKTPAELRLVMIDPKVVELAVFDRIPHMLLPVVTDMAQAAQALRWAVYEMERRYRCFAEVGARNLQSYNARVDKALSEGPDLGGERSSSDPERLPSIVLVVDEFADLIMVAGKEVEDSIARLTQKARACGIHMILATQRPSVDVIPGKIKANLPARISFKVAQREDSKTILGRHGAEQLLGLGDMLCRLPGSDDLVRVHSAFISEDEVRAFCDYLRAVGAPVYDQSLLGDGITGAEPPSDDALYDRAVAAATQAGSCSIAQIQRELTVPYTKAAKLVERMESEGVVGPGKAGGRREVLAGRASA